jgi:hypothetical protein
VALGTVAGLFTVLALDLFSAAWLERLYFVVESLVPAVLLHFALCFPEEKAVVRRHPWLKWGVYAACAPFAILQNWFLARDPERHLVVNDWVYVTAAVAGVVSMAALVHGAVRFFGSPLRRETGVRSGVAGARRVLLDAEGGDGRVVRHAQVVAEPSYVLQPQRGGEHRSGQ